MSRSNEFKRAFGIIAVYDVASGRVSRDTYGWDLVKKSIGIREEMKFQEAQRYLAGLAQDKAYYWPYSQRRMNWAFMLALDSTIIAIYSSEERLHNPF